jgi:hypothetical protein
MREKTDGKKDGASFVVMLSQIWRGAIRAFDAASCVLFFWILRQANKSRAEPSELRAAVRIFVAILVLYPLSVGPAALMYERLENPHEPKDLDRAFWIVYRPMLAACRFVGSERIFWWYVRNFSDTIDSPT